MKKIVVATTLILSACAPTAVTEVSRDSVTVQSAFSSVDPISADSAHRLCAKRGGYAKHASTREVQTPNYLPNKYQHMFRCVPGSRKPTSGGYLNSKSTF